MVGVRIRHAFVRISSTLNSSFEARNLLLLSRAAQYMIRERLAGRLRGRVRYREKRVSSLS